MRLNEVIRSGEPLPATYRVVSGTCEASATNKWWISPGSMLIVLSYNEEEVMDFRDEAHPVKPCRPSDLPDAFTMRSTEKAFDDQSYSSVAEIMELPEDQRPRYVRSLDNWVSSSVSDSFESDQVFRVTKGGTSNHKGTACYKWERCNIPAAQLPGFTWFEMDEVKGTRALLTPGTFCTFVPDLDGTVYTKGEIDSLCRKQSLKYPVRLQAAQIKKGQGDGRLPSTRLNSDRYVLRGLKKASWLLVLVMNQSITSTVQPEPVLVRFPILQAGNAIVCPVDACAQVLYRALSHYTSGADSTSLPVVKLQSTEETPETVDTSAEYMVMRSVPPVTSTKGQAEVKGMGRADGIFKSISRETAPCASSSSEDSGEDDYMTINGLR